MAYAKPIVTIELAEYNELLEKKTLKGTPLTREEYEACYTSLVVAAIQNPELINSPPAAGIAMRTAIGIYIAKLGEDKIFRFTKHGA